MGKESINNIFNAFKEQGIDLDDTQKKRIEERLQKITTYVPKVGIFGKTGVGKSSLANALFGTDVCKISDIASCTRNPQEIVLGIAGDKGISLLDVPGVGESSDRDVEYGKLYQKLLPELDVVLWLLKGDDRAFTSDQLFYENIVKPHIEKGKQFFFVINQVDKIEPYREWDEKKRKPGMKQQQNINSKIEEVSRYFDTPVSKIVPASANEKYNLVNLMDEIVFALPPEKLVTFAKAVNPEMLSDKAKEHIKKESTNYVLTGAIAGATIGATVGGPIGAAVGGAIGAAVGFISSFF
jgi:small GTP-binding protein